MTDSSLVDLSNPSVPVPEAGQYEVGIETVLKAVYHDPRDPAEKDLAALQLRVWNAIEKLLTPETYDEAGRRLLDLSFPGWEKRALVQLAAALGSAMTDEVNRHPIKDRPIKLPALAAQPEPSNP